MDLLPLNCVTLDKLLKLLTFSFLMCKVKVNFNVIPHRVFGTLNEITCVEPCTDLYLAFKTSESITTTSIYECLNDDFPS